MESKTVFFLALFASSVSMILSIPQVNILPVQEPADANVDQNQQAPSPNELVANNVPQINPRTIGSLFNLSAYLANAPNNSAALNFVPLITILSALGG